jgi:perosamine synthetase
MSITTSLSPNVQSDDLGVTVKTLFSFWRWRDKSITKEIERKLSKYFVGHDAVLLSSGRSAIYHTLMALGVDKGDEVIIQAFTCLAVPAPVMWTGAKPIYADIQRETYNFDIEDVKKKISSRTKAIIVQHTFGIPAPVRELKKLAEEHKIFLIEDLAHSFGATVNGQMLGTFGDAAILSFGRDKTVSCVFGGAVISSNTELVDKIRSEQNNHSHPPFWWTKQQLLHPLLMAVVKPLYFSFGIGKALLVVAQKMKLLSLAVSKKEKAGVKPSHLNWRFSPALGFLLDNQLDKIDRYTDRRREIAGKYISKFKMDATYGLVQDNVGWLRFPLTVDNPKNVFSEAKNINILLGDWYGDPVTPIDPDKPKLARYVPGSCPNAEYMSAHVVNLPTHPTLSDEDVDKVIQFISDNIIYD